VDEGLVVVEEEVIVGDGKGSDCGNWIKSKWASGVLLEPTECS
jgi:hypothetical protein